MPSKKKPKYAVNTLSPSSSLSLDRWLAIANLILTGIVGIAIAIYLQYNNQKFSEEQQLNQQSFLATQQAIQLEFQSNQSISNIIKNSYLGMLGNFDTYPIKDIEKHFRVLFDFSNRGPAIANNLNISVCIYSTGPMWESTRDSIEAFEITPIDSSMNYEKLITNRECNGKRPNGITNNTVLFSFKFLPPNQYIRISLRPPEHPLGTEVTDSTKVHALIPNSILSTNPNEKIYIFSGRGSSDFTTAMDGYLSNKSALATFYAEGSCDNCKVNIENVFYLRGVSTANDRKIANLEITDQGSFYAKVTFDLTMTYFLPENGTRIFSNPDLYLILFQNGNEDYWYYEFDDIEQPKFDTYNLDTR